MDVTRQLEELSRQQKMDGELKSGLKDVSKEVSKKNVRICDPNDDPDAQNEEKKMAKDDKNLDYLDVIETIETVSDAVESGYHSVIGDKISSSASPSRTTFRRTSRSTTNDFELSESYL